MKKILHKAWAHLFISGISSLFFGIVILVFPTIPLLSLVWLFAAYVIMKGLALTMGAWQNRHEGTHWVFLLWYGILNLITGITTSVFPGVTLLILGFILSMNLLMSGILQIIMAFHLHREIKGAGWLIFSGAIATIAGIYIYLIPRIGALTILYLLAIAAIVLSVFLISLSLKAANWHSGTNKQAIQMK